MRDSRIYLQDILQAVIKIEKYTKNCTLATYKKNELVKDAVLRNLGVIGEAANYLSVSDKRSMSNIEWRKIISLRNILIHEYFGIDDEIIWDVIGNKLPELKQAVSKNLK